jgi:hypothetical protein
MWNSLRDDTRWLWDLSLYDWKEIAGWVGLKISPSMVPSTRQYKQEHTALYDGKKIGSWDNLTISSSMLPSMTHYIKKKLIISQQIQLRLIY